MSDGLKVFWKVVQLGETLEGETFRDFNQAMDAAKERGKDTPQAVLESVVAVIDNSVVLPER